MLIRILLAVLCAVVITSCDGGGPRPPTGNTVRYVTYDEPKRLDPAYIKDLYEGIISGLVYEGLVRFGAGAEIEPALADSWDVSAGNTRYAFHLRNALFHNGRPVTSADVRYSLTRILLPETGSDRKWVLDRLEGAQDVISGTTTVLSGIETSDERTVVLTLRQPYPVFLKMLAMPNAVVIPEGSGARNITERVLDEKPIGTGPWKFDKWLHDQRIELSANREHWGDSPKADRFMYFIQADEKVQRQQFEVGNVDVYQVGFTVFDVWQRDPARRKLMKPAQELRTDFMGFMNNKPALSDVRVRQAISHAINTRAIFEHIQKGRGVLAHGPVPPGCPGYRPEVQPREYSPQRARELLVAAGAGKLSLALWYREEVLSSEIAAAIKADLTTVGIEVRLAPRDLAALRSAVHNGEPDIYLGSWTLDYPDPENALFPPFHSSNIPRQGNGSHFSDAAVDALIDAARSDNSFTFSGEANTRLLKYAEAEDAIIERCPWVFLFHRATHYAVQPWLAGWEPALMYNADRFTSAHFVREHVKP